MIKLLSKCRRSKHFVISFFTLSASCIVATYFLQQRFSCDISWTESQKSIWTFKPIGRLGNNMGNYAVLYTLAKINGHRAYILPEMHKFLSPIFNISLPVLPQRNYTKICWREYDLHDWMSEEYKYIGGKHVKLTGYTSSWTFYHHIRDEIHRQFSFHHRVKKEANDYLQKLKGLRKNVTFIGVHVRRGDYVKVMSRTWKGVVADKAYLYKAMSYFRSKYHQPIFLVASNGMRWCKNNIDASRGDVHFLDEGNERSPWKDFALLAHCNHTIMTIGTFGYWAGYLAGGETIYLTNFTLPDSPFLKVFHYDAAYLPHWVGISADLPTLVKNKFWW